MKGELIMKRFITLALLAAFLFAGATPAMAEFQDMWANVYKKTAAWQKDVGDMTRLTTGVTFKVLAIDSDTAETLYEYNDNAFTSLTNPISTTNFASATVCDDKVAFRVDPNGLHERPLRGLDRGGHRRRVHGLGRELRQVPAHHRH